MVSNVPTLPAYRHLQDLGVASVVVAFRVEFKGDFPLFGEGREGCQKGVFLYEMFRWKGK